MCRVGGLYYRRDSLEEGGPKGPHLLLGEFGGSCSLVRGFIGAFFPPPFFEYRLILGMKVVGFPAFRPGQILGGAHKGLRARVGD